MRTLGSLCLLAFCLSWALPVLAQETLSSVQRELDRVEKEIEREKELHKQERKRAADFEVQKSQRLRALQDQFKASQDRMDSLKREVDKARRQKTTQKAQAQFYLSKEKEFRNAFATALRGLAEDLRKDFPYNREKRVADVEELAKSLDEGVIPSEEALNRLTGLLAASLDFASEVEVYAGVYSAKTGGSFEGSYIRLGATFLGFISQDGKLGALLVRQASDYQWQDSELSPEEREALAAAVRVAQGKESPRLVGLPIALHAGMKNETDKKSLQDSTAKTGAQP